MTELIGRFLGFEEKMGRGLVTFGYYLLLFLLVVTTLYDLLVAFAGFFGAGFFGNLGKFLVLIPVRFVVMLIGLRVATEFVLAVLNVEDSLKADPLDADMLSSGLNPVRRPVSPAQTPEPEAPAIDEDELADEPVTAAASTKKRTRKSAKKTTATKKTKKATTKKSAKAASATTPEAANDPAPTEPSPPTDED
ncbi:MAG: DUF4282 domain-containing protein [Pseudomonadota bacterium]